MTFFTTYFKRLDAPQSTALLTILVGIATISLKFSAYLWTRSAAFYADAFESLLNVFTASIAFAAISYARLPPDDTHQYGHHKVEDLSSILQGIAITFMGGCILYSSYKAVVNPENIVFSYFGIIMSLVSTTINALWWAFLYAKSKQTRSPALHAEAQHLRLDCLLSMSIFIGAVVALTYNLTLFDALICALVALYIVFSGLNVLVEALSALLDRSANAHTLKVIRDLIATNGEGAIEAHDLKTRRHGQKLFIEFHLVVPDAMSVQSAHDICDRIEDALIKRLDYVEVNIHIEPSVHAKQVGLPIVH